MKDSQEQVVGAGIVEPRSLGARSLVFGVLASGLLVSAALAQGNFPPTAVLLLRYDMDEDGTITSEEIEAGVGAEHAAADLDNDNCIDSSEIRAENDRRLDRDGGLASPVVDWNLDGCVDLVEYGSSVRSYFNFVDRSRDGTVGQVELRGGSMPLPLPGRTVRPPPTQPVPRDVQDGIYIPGPNTDRF